MPAAGQKARAGRGGLGEKPAGGTACLFLTAFAQQEKGLARGLGLQAETAAFRQTEMGRIAPNLENNGAEGAAFHRGLGQPERIVELARRRMKKAVPCKAEMNEADGMGQARFHRSHRIADPQNRGEGPAGAHLLLGLHASRQSGGETAGGTGIHQKPAADFAQSL